MIKVLALVGLLAGCTKKEFYEGRTFAGDVYASAKTLNEGKRLYTKSCMACHGAKGDGKGVAAKGMQVPPRDFTLGLYKFGKVPAGELPHDTHFFEILDHGLAGTAMLPWDLTHGEKRAIVQYLKTFAPETWQGPDKTLGEEIRPTKDPYGLAHKKMAIEKGREIYHIVGSCQTCHQAYATQEQISQWSQKAGEGPLGPEDFEEDLHQTKPQESEYNYRTIPPDFTWNPVRSAQTVEQLYVRIAAGVGGTTMPGWRDVLSNEQLWAVAYYVRSLMDKRDPHAR